MYSMLFYFFTSVSLCIHNMNQYLEITSFQKMGKKQFFDFIFGNLLYFNN